MIKKLLLMSLVCLGLTGCGSKEVEPVETQTLEIAMLGNEVCALELPADMELTELDGFHYWKFDEDTTIYKTKAAVVIGDKKDNCYYTTYAVSRNFDDCTLTISTAKDKVKTVGALLNKAEVFERDVVQFKERGLDYLPEFQDYPMSITTNGLYMPVDYNEVTSDVFTSCHSINHTSFVTCWIMNYKFEDLKPLLDNLVTCNSGSDKLESWYQRNDIYYVTAGDKVVAAKKLTYNQWCCYLASNDSFADYVIKAMYRVAPKQ